MYASILQSRCEGFPGRLRAGRIQYPKLRPSRDSRIKKLYKSISMENHFISQNLKYKIKKPIDSFQSISIHEQVNVAELQSLLAIHDFSQIVYYRISDFE
jgi:hypothetical protein